MCFFVCVELAPFNGSGIDLLIYTMKAMCVGGMSLMLIDQSQKGKALTLVTLKMKAKRKYNHPVDEPLTGCIKHKNEYTEQNLSLQHANNNH